MNQNSEQKHTKFWEEGERWLVNENIQQKKS